jgi:exodeoxyribonuclease VII large subunit
MRRQLEGQTAALHSAFLRQLVGRRNELDGLTTALGRASETVLLRRRGHWQQLHSSLEALSPKAILARGYALVFDDQGRLVKQAAQLKPGSRVRAQLGRGEFTAKVDRVKDEPDDG